MSTLLLLLLLLRQPNYLNAREAQLAAEESNQEQRLVLCRLLNNISKDDLEAMLPTPGKLKGKLVMAVEAAIEDHGDSDDSAIVSTSTM